MISDGIVSILDINKIKMYNLKKIVSEASKIKITDVPAEIISCIEKIINDHHININNIDANQVKSLLKRMNYPKYYKYSFIISCALKNIIPPTINKKDIEIIFSIISNIAESNECIMFHKMSCCNFYLRKICNLLYLDEYLDYFILPEYFEKKIHLLDDQLIWKKLCDCNYKKWMNYPGFYNT